MPSEPEHCDATATAKESVPKTKRDGSYTRLVETSPSRAWTHSRVPLPNGLHKRLVSWPAPTATIATTRPTPAAGNPRIARGPQTPGGTAVATSSMTTVKPSATQPRSQASDHVDERTAPSKTCPVHQVKTASTARCPTKAGQDHRQGRRSSSSSDRRPPKSRAARRAVAAKP